MLVCAFVHVYVPVRACAKYVTREKDEAAQTLPPLMASRLCYTEWQQTKW